jgi:hypothetical protein
MFLYKKEETERDDRRSIMQCPICGNEMKNGKICARAGGGLFWLPKEEEIGFIVSNNKIKKHNGIVLVNCNELQIKHTAYVCEECRRIIMDF